MNKEPENKGIQIELTEEVGQGTYSNLAVIAHSSSEFVIDFVRIMPGIPKAKVKSRVILSPENTKRLMLALMDNVKKYEAQFSEIKLQDQGFAAPIIGPIGEA
ncbi:MAG: DUF3467 domain-containing protein [Dysgonamonadaceae bacterium]|nr:DUF3467 domain-containing protein [Dysgonamonadaceae bacterium]